MTEHYLNISLENIVAEVDGVLYVEEWLPIAGYNGAYDVSTFGRIKSNGRSKLNNGGFASVFEKIRKQVVHKNDYLRIPLSKYGKTKTHYVHRLVAKAFIDADSELDVNHKDVNTSNNFYKNLEFCTEEYNMKYAVYVSNTKGKIKLKSAAEARKKFLSGVTINEISIQLSISKYTVCDILKGRSWYFMDDPDTVKKCKTKYNSGISIKKKVIATNMLTGKKEIFPSLNMASIMLNLSVSNISQNVKGNRKRVGEYTFKSIG